MCLFYRFRKFIFRVLINILVSRSKILVLLMASYFQEAQDHGAEMDHTTQVSLILNSLTPAFLPYTSNYVMNKKDIDFHELVNDLQTYENLIGGPKKKGSKPQNSGNGNGTIKPEANVASASKPKSKKKWKNTKKRAKAMKNKKAAASGDATLKGKCFYCNEKGHWKPQCPKLLARKQGISFYKL
ncbi:hypothetical protein CsatA_009665 [Cannabis sativa]